MNIEDYIRQNFNANKVEPITQNGQVVGYYAQNSRTKNEIYIPVSAVNNQNVGMVSYIPGSGGSNPDANVLRDQIRNYPPNYIISISSGCGDDNNCIQTGLQMAQGLNSNVGRNVTVCFSASGFIGVKRNEELLASNPNIKTAIISCEPYGSFNPQNGYNLANSQTPIIFAAPDSGFHIGMLDLIKDYKNNGLNAFLMETDYSSNAHVQTNRDILSSGILAYLLGEADDFDRTKGGGQGWDLLKYDPETGQIVYATYDETRGAIVISAIDINKLSSFEPHTITTESSQVNSKYGLLKDVGKIGDANLTTFSSEYKLVYDNVNDIRTNIGSSSFVGQLSNQVFRSYEGIPGCIGYNVDTYFDAVGSLLNTLGLETESIMSYAESIVQLDKELAEGHKGELVLKDNSDKVIPLGIEKPVDKPKEENSDNNNNNNNANNANNNNNNANGNNNNNGYSGYNGGHNSSGGHSSSGNSGANALAGGAMAGILGHDQAEELPDDQDLNLEEVGPCYDENIKPDEIYDFEGYEGFIYTDKDDKSKVTGIKYRYTYENEEEANAKLEEIKAQYKDNDAIKEVIVKDNHIDVIFKNESFENKNKEAVVAEYFKDGVLREEQNQTPNEPDSATIEEGIGTTDEQINQSPIEQSNDAPTDGQNDSTNQPAEEVTDNG